MTDILLRPVDRLFFGAPKGQTAGEIHAGRTEFPPSPHTTAGLVRTRLLEDAAARGTLAHGLGDRAGQDERAALVGTRNTLPKGWQLHAALPVAPGANGRLVPWLPMPDLVEHTSDGLARLPREALSDEATRGLLADDDPPDGGRQWFGRPAERRNEKAPQWLPATDLARLLAGHDVPLKGGGGRFPPFVHAETTTGVAIDDRSRRPRNAMLYSLETLRFDAGAGLLVRADIAADPKLDDAALGRGLARAGRKGHFVELRAVGGELDAAWTTLHAPPPYDDVRDVWLYLATPARLDGPALDPRSLRPPPSVGVKVVAAWVREPQFLGGLDSVAMRPEPVARSVRAGSAWRLRLDGDREAIQAWLDSLHGRPSLGEWTAFGYGLTFVGRFSPAPVTTHPGEDP